MKLRWIAAALLAVVSAGLARADSAGEALANDVAKAAGADRWRDVRRVRFTWRHEAKGAARAYDWDVKKGEVAGTLGGKTVKIPAAMAKLSGDEDAAQRAFINDSYWLLFPLHLAWDAGVTFEDLGALPVPGFDALGPRRALAVRYAAGGYTPGDRYVLYLGDDLFPVAWAYHPGGAAEPKLVARWAEKKTLAGVTVPTRFEKPNGEAIVTIADVSIE